MVHNHKNVVHQQSDGEFSSVRLERGPLDILVLSRGRTASRLRPFMSSSCPAVLVEPEHSGGASESVERLLKRDTHTAITQRKGEDTLTAREEIIWLADGRLRWCCSPTGVFLLLCAARAPT